MSSRRCPPYDSEPASAVRCPTSPRKRISSRRARRHARVALDVGPAVEMRPRRAPARRAAGSRAIDTRGNRLVIWNERAEARPRRSDTAAVPRSTGRQAGPSLVGREHAGDQVEHASSCRRRWGRSARAACDRERRRRIGHRLDAAERLREVARLQHDAPACRRVLAGTRAAARPARSRARPSPPPRRPSACNGSVSRRQTPTSPVGENTMKPTNSRPKYSSQFGVQIDRYSGTGCRTARPAPDRAGCACRR